MVEVLQITKIDKSFITFNMQFNSIEICSNVPCLQFKMKPQIATLFSAK